MTNKPTVQEIRDTRDAQMERLGRMQAEHQQINDREKKAALERDMELVRKDIQALDSLLVSGTQAGSNH